jgi:broad specificity phosphatase PhoE
VLLSVFVAHQQRHQLIKCAVAFSFHWHGDVSQVEVAILLMFVHHFCAPTKYVAAQSNALKLAMNRAVRRRLLSLGVWPSLVDAAEHVAWKLQLFCVALLHLLFSSDKQWLSSLPSSSVPENSTVLQLDPPSPSCPVLTKRKRLLFIRHAESEWNVVFNRGLDLRAPLRLLKAVAREWLLLPSGDSLLLDSPLSRRGRFQAQSLQDLVASEQADQLLSHLSCPRPDSLVVCSNLRRAIDTARIASAARLEAPGECIHVLSCLQEIGRNLDTLALSAPHSVHPREVLAQPPRGEKQHDELFNVAESHGNKAVLGSGQERLHAFANWVFKQHKDVVVVYGHSLWFRAFCREFFPRNAQHEFKSAKMSNCGVVTFVLEERSTGGGEAAHYNIQAESFQQLV